MKWGGMMLYKREIGCFTMNRILLTHYFNWFDKAENYSNLF